MKMRHFGLSAHVFMLRGPSALLIHRRVKFAPPPISLESRNYPSVEPASLVNKGMPAGALKSCHLSDLTPTTFEARMTKLAGGPADASGWHSANRVARMAR